MDAVLRVLYRLLVRKGARFRSQFRRRGAACRCRQALIDEGAIPAEELASSTEASADGVTRETKPPCHCHGIEPFQEHRERHRTQSPRGKPETRGTECAQKFVLLQEIECRARRLELTPCAHLSIEPGSAFEARRRRPFSRDLMASGRDDKRATIARVDAVIGACDPNHDFLCDVIGGGRGQLIADEAMHHRVERRQELLKCATPFPACVFLLCAL